jgi:hypothetical protein
VRTGFAKDDHDFVLLGTFREEHVESTGFIKKGRRHDD